MRANIMCSRIGFGGSRLHHLPTAQARHNILETAYECGINYFDVAPLYGSGLAERALGRFLDRHSEERKKLVIATKWGLPAEPWTDRLSERCLPYASAVVNFKRKFVGAISRPLLTPELLVSSVEQSLRRLGTSYIDILWMHEPEPALLPCPASVYAQLRELCLEGKIRFAGVAGYSSHVESTLQAFAATANSDFPLLQQIDELGWSPKCVPDVTFSAISQGPQKARVPRLEATTAKERLRNALARRKQGVVLISTTRPENLRQLTGRTCVS